MSTDRATTQFYLFSLKGGGKKIAYGRDPRDAIEILSLRLTDEELAMVNEDKFIKVRQQDLPKYLGELS